MPRSPHARCVSCHGPDSAQGGLRLDSADAIARGGDSGLVLAAGHPDRSELLRRIRLPPSHKDAMPPRGRRPVTASESALLAWWVGRRLGWATAVALLALLHPDTDTVARHLAR